MMCCSVYRPHRTVFSCAQSRCTIQDYGYQDFGYVGSRLYSRVPTRVFLQSGYVGVRSGLMDEIRSRNPKSGSKHGGRVSVYDILTLMGRLDL